MYYEIRIHIPMRVSKKVTNALSEILFLFLTRISGKFGVIPTGCIIYGEKDSPNEREE